MVKRHLTLAEQALWRALSEAETAQKHARRAGFDLNFNNIQHAIDIERHELMNAIEETDSKKGVK